MSTTIDSKVVEMRFDNKNFESNAATTISTLSRLKQALNLPGSSKGLNDVSRAASDAHMPMLGLSSAVETVRNKFSALEVMGVTALANITNSAVNAGKKIVSALTIDSIKSGFSEYETQINAVQTILANTKSKGTTLDDVNGALDELNTYADKTIYNFTEMTRNIGTFTAAGVDLDTSVSAIKGIANLAAVSGSNSQQASTAMYQLSQALASGTVKLMDWNSVVNAGMGGQIFQDSLKETAKVHGKNVDAMIKKEGSFRETLKSGWLTSEILTETLAKFTGDLDEATLKKQGYTEKQIKEIMELGKMANDAATKVKTLTQLFDTLKEAAQSGWAQSWEIIVGDFEEAKKLFTDISDTLGKMIGDSAESRNKVLQGWKDLGGRTAVVDSLKNAFEGVMSWIKPIGEAFREIFPPVTAKRLNEISQNLKKFTEGLKISGETSDKVKRIFKGFFAILDIVKKVVTAVTSAFFDLSQSEGIGSLADLFLDVGAAIGDFFTSLNAGIDADGLTGALSSVSSLLSDLFKSLSSGLSGVGQILSWAGNGIIKVVEKIGSVCKDVFGWLADNISAGDIFAGLAGGGIFAMTKEATSFFEGLSGIIDKLFGTAEGMKGIKDHIVETLNAVSDSLKSFTVGINVWSIVGIAVSVALLTNALEKLAKLNAFQIGKSLLSVGIMISMLTFSFKSLTKTLDRFKPKGVVKSAFALILIAKAVDILADVMVKVGKLSWDEIAKGLAGIGGALLELGAAVKIISSTKISLSTSVAIVALAYACDILGDALKKFGSMSWDEIGRGLSAMGGALTELVVAIKVLQKTGGLKSIFSSAAILILVQGLGDLADALQKFGKMSWSEIGHGLTAMGGALTELGVVLGGLGKIAGFSSIFAAASIVTVIQGLDDLANALQKFGAMTWSEIGRGLTGMGGALTELGIVLGALGKIAGFSSLFAAGSILTVIQGLDDLADALGSFGLMTWSEIGRGLTAMGGALLEVAGMSGALGKIAGFSGILGSGAILATIQGLDDLANALQKFGAMSWSEIGRGLSAMGGALLEIGTITGALGYLTNFAGLLGAGSIWVIIQGLDDLANAFQKFGSMSWSEIGRGLSAMGGALAELAVGGALNSLSIIGAFSISEMVKPLDDLANALQKFGSMSWDEVKTGLAAMGGALAELAYGGLANTFSGLGSLSIAAVAEPLGTLADSVKKWKDVTVPEGLGWQLTRLASGIFSFTLDGAGARAISTVAAPIGVLADSVKKWDGVTVPEGIGDELEKLSKGVFQFTTEGLASINLARVAAPLGTMADSVKKWTDVDVPDTIGDDLGKIADGIKKFTFAFAGGWSMTSIIGPLQQLPKAFTTWKDVKIPATLTTDLENLANGISAFSFGFMGGWSISTIIQPLTQLPDAISKWTNVKVPAGIETGLTSIATGIGAFSLLDAAKLAMVDDNIVTLGNAIKGLSGVTIDSELIKNNLTAVADGVSEFSLIDTAKLQMVDDNILNLSNAFKNFASASFDGAKLITFAEKINECSTKLKGLDTSAIDTAKTAVNKIVGIINTVNSTSTSNIASFVKAANSLNTIDVSKINVDTTNLSSAIDAVKSAMSKIGTSISDSKTTITNAMKTAMSGTVTPITDQTTPLTTAATKLTDAISKTVSDKKGTVTKAFETLVSGGATAISKKKSSFESAGKDLGSGLVTGIKAKYQAAYNAGYGLGQMAVQGEKDGQQSNSPSKLTILAGKWMGQGLIIGMDKMGRSVYRSGYNLGETATDSIKSTVSKIADLITDDIDNQPTIRPVVDLSNVRAGAAAVSGMFSATPSVGLLTNIGSINSTMNRRHQNGGSDEVVSAIKDLKKTINNMPRNNTNIGDISYGDDSNISSAVSQLVRAAKMERRT